jgi:AraC-like DNA-binding protein
MESIVPIIGSGVLDKNEGLKARIRYIIEEEFGHELRFVDEGSVFVLHRANPLKLLVPFTVTIEGATDVLAEKDMLEPIRMLFPSSVHIKSIAPDLPRLLKGLAKEISLGHLNGAPIELRKATKVIYKRMDEESLSVPLVAKEIGVSKSTLERVSHTTLSLGAGHIISQFRMQEAKRMILETEFPINTIGFAVGYSSLSSFDRTFFHFWGHSATDLRQNAKSMSQYAK